MSPLVSVVSKLFHHLSTFVELIVCFSSFVVLVLFLKSLLLDPFSSLLGLLCHHSLLQFLNPSRCYHLLSQFLNPSRCSHSFSQFLNPSRCSAQSHLANDHPNFLALDRHELHVLTSSPFVLVPETHLFWAFLSMVLVVHLA